MAVRGAPFFLLPSRYPPSVPIGLVLTGSPSWQAGRDQLMAVWPQHPAPGAKGNQSWTRPTRRAEGRARREAQSVSLLSPTSLRKATQNISPQTCQTRGSGRPRCLPPSGWGAHGRRRKRPERRERQGNAACGSHAPALLPPSTRGPAVATWWDLGEVALSRGGSGPRSSWPAGREVGDRSGVSPEPGGNAERCGHFGKDCGSFLYS